MIADLKSYLKYKESGQEWLGEVPEHWSVFSARQVGRLLKGVGGSKEDARPAGVPCIRYGELYTKFQYFIRRPFAFVHPDRSIAYMPIQYGDVLFAASGEKMEEIGKSAVNLMDGAAVCGGDVIILRPNDTRNSEFLGYACDAPAAAIQKSVMGRGTTIKHIYPSELRRLVVALPPPAEQSAIVRFLDHWNGRMEKAIRSKRRVIALLQEQKQAIIHRAVTRGLDPNVKLKDSGISWLGEIPEHWGVIAAKRVCSMVRDGTHLPPPRTASGFPLLSVRNIINGQLVRRDDDSFVSSQDFRILNSSFDVRLGDVLMAVVGATLGKVAIVEDIGPFQIQRSLGILRPRAGVLSSRYLAQYLRSPQLQQHLWRSVAFSAQPGIYLGFVSNLPIPIPPTTQEQDLLCTHIDNLTHPLTTAITRYENEITLLREYRTRLTADVVTGKLDVRAAAAQLPEQAEEEPLPDPEIPEEETETEDETEDFAE
jgi:type I restriction enzyme S subunit